MDDKTKTQDAQVGEDSAEIERLRAERDLLKFKIEAMERSYIEKRQVLNAQGKEILRKRLT